MENINYKELVAERMAYMSNMEMLEAKIERNFLDGEDTEDYVNVYVEEIIDCHYGSKIPAIFCGLFIKNYNEEADIEEVMWDFDKITEAVCNWLDEHKSADLKGNFFITSAESDGSLALYFSKEKEELAFSDWRKAEGYKSWDSYLSSELSEDREYEDIKEEYDAIKEEYEEYCEQYHYIQFMDED